MIWSKEWAPSVLQATVVVLVSSVLPAASAGRSVATLTLSPPVSTPTTVTVATGSGFAPGERVVLRFDHRRLDITQASPEGTFTEDLTVPATAITVEHVVSAQGVISGDATDTFTVRTDWPTARFVPEGTGHNPYENVLSPSTVGGLELAWSMPTEGSLSSTPIVVDGVVYVAGHVGETADAGIYAFDALTGRPLWSRADSGQPPSDLAVADGTLYVSFIQGHVLRAYDAVTGDLMWESPGPTRAPTVVDGVVYAADNLRSLWAIDAQTGDKLWVAHVPFGGFGSGLAVANGMVYVGGRDLDGTSPVYAYDASTGDMVWRTKTGGAVYPTPAVANGTVFVGSGSGDQALYALGARTGRVRWTALVGGAIASPAAVANGMVYVGCADGKVYAFDARTGEELWVAPAGGVINPAQAAVVANGVVYIGSPDENVHTFDAVTGKDLWSYQTGGGVFKQSVVNGTLYVTSFDSHLYAFRLPA